MPCMCCLHPSPSSACFGRHSAANLTPCHHENSIQSLSSNSTPSAFQFTMLLHFYGKRGGGGKHQQPELDWNIMMAWRQCGNTAGREGRARELILYKIKKVS
ncbi:hypothetical protein FKM82_015228 [Ascaphus truei]